MNSCYSFYIVVYSYHGNLVQMAVRHHLHASYAYDHLGTLSNFSYALQLQILRPP